MFQWKSDYLTNARDKLHYYSNFRIQRHEKMGDISPRPSPRPTLVFLHGYMDGAIGWDRVARNFIADYDIVIPDSRGHGKSVDAPQNYNYDLYLEDLSKIFAEIDISKAILIGHSMGAVGASLFAIKYPELVSKIVIEDPAFKASLLNKFFIRGLQFLLIFKKVRKSPRPDWIYRVLIRIYNFRWHENDMVPLIQALREYDLHSSSKSVRLLPTAPNITTIFPLIACPVLLITSSWGISPKRKIRKIIKQFPLIQWEHIRKGAHSIRRDQYSQYMASVHQFLAED